jgi:hypothetical protein
MAFYLSVGILFREGGKGFLSGRENEQCNSGNIVIPAPILGMDFVMSFPRSRESSIYAFWSSRRKAGRIYELGKRMKILYCHLEGMEWLRDLRTA